MQVGSQEELNRSLELLLRKKVDRESIKNQLMEIDEEGRESLQKSYDEIMKYI